MEKISCNCIICAREILSDEVIDDLLTTNSAFKVCKICLDESSPEDDFNLVKKILESFNLID